MVLLDGVGGLILDESDIRVEVAPVGLELSRHRWMEIQGDRFIMPVDQSTGCRSDAPDGC